MNQFLSIALKTHFESLKVGGKGENYWQCYQAFLKYCDIYGDCALAKDRREYKKITKNIAQLIKWKGNDTAKSLIEELMQRYPRKPALVDELEKVEKKL